jgi:hypothetical protein
MKTFLGVLTAITMLSVLSQTGSASGQQDRDAAVITSLETSTVVWQITSDDLDGDRQEEVIMGGVDHFIYVTDRKGRTLWKYDVGGLPLSIATGDMNGDGVKEIVAACQDTEGSVCVLAYKKGELWRFSAQQAFLSVATADIDGDGKYEVLAGSFAGKVYALDKERRVKWKRQLNRRGSVTAIGAGDVNGDKMAEVFVGVQEGGIYALDGKGKKLWRHRSRLRKSSVKGARIERIRTVALGDINGDGRPEVIVGSDPYGMVTVLNATGVVVWRKNFPKSVNRTSIAQVAIGNFVGSHEPEIAVLCHGILPRGDRGKTPFFVLDVAGNRIVETLPDVSLVSLSSGNTDQDSYKEILFSSATRGHFFYILEAHGGKLPKSLSLKRPDQLDQLAKTVAKRIPRGGEDRISGLSRHVLIAWNIREDRKSMAQLKGLLDKLKSPRISIELMLTGVFEEDSNPLDEYIVPRRLVRWKRTLYSQEEILNRIKNYEKLKVPFFVLLGTHRRLHMRLDTLEKILQLKSTWLRGFIVNENSYSKAIEFKGYLLLYKKVMGLLQKHGKKLIVDEYLDFWYKILHDPDAFQGLFRPEYRDILIPMYKTNNFKAPELNIGTVLGLWKMGLFKEWGFSAQDDSWKWESIFMNPPHDVLLRLEVMAASLGATYFRVEANGDFLEPTDGGVRVTDEARRHRNLFHDLCRKGFIRPIADCRQVTVSPVAIHVLPDQSIMPKAFVHQDEYWQNVYTQKGPLAYKFPLQVTSDSYVPSYLYSMAHYYEGFFPKTPYGYVVLLPSPAIPLSISGIKSCWVADGAMIYQTKGNKMSASKAKGAILKDIGELSRDLPFRCDEAFLAVNEFENEYRLYLISPGFLDVADTQVSIEIRAPVAELIDLVSEKRVGWQGKSATVNIPAGTFRILSAVKIKTSTGGKAAVHAE